VEYDNRAMIIAGICVVVGTILMLIGIITSEIEITKNQTEEIYDNSYY
jgi:hypothetical protein